MFQCQDCYSETLKHPAAEVNCGQEDSRNLKEQWLPMAVTAELVAALWLTQTPGIQGTWTDSLQNSWKKVFSLDSGINTQATYVCI